MNKLYPIYFSITKETIKKLTESEIKGIAQVNLSQNPPYPRRTAKDGEINWNNSSKDIRNLIRAVSKPYPGAFSYVNNHKIILWKAKIIPLEKNDKDNSNGTIITAENNSFTVKCNDAKLLVTHYTTNYNLSLINKSLDTNYINKNVNFYSDLIEKYDLDVKSLNWGSRQSQEMRFDLFAQLDNLNQKSILDIGCGLGDFYNWLESNTIQTDYKGIDITPKMIEKAKERFPDANFAVENILESNTNKKYDYVVASGIFYLVEQEPFEFMKKMIQKMFAIAEKGIAFNSLSSWADQKHENEFYANPSEVIDFCRTLSRKVVLKHHYHPADFTVYLYK